MPASTLAWDVARGMERTGRSARQHKVTASMFLMRITKAEDIFDIHRSASTYLSLSHARYERRRDVWRWKMMMQPCLPQILSAVQFFPLHLWKRHTHSTSGDIVRPLPSLIHSVCVHSFTFSILRGSETFLTDEEVTPSFPHYLFVV
jgi:hypothetical protein